MNDKKISELNLLVLTLDLLKSLNQNQLLVPSVLDNNTGWINYALDLGSLINSMLNGCIQEKVNEAIARYSEGVIGSNTGNNSSGEGVSQAVINDLSSRISNLENTMLDATVWPKHTIRVTDGSNTVENILYTHPNGNSVTIELESTRVARPLLFVTLSLNQPALNSGTLTGGIRAVISAKDNEGNVYDGATVLEVGFAIGYYSGGSYHDLNGGNYIASTSYNTSLTIQGSVSRTYLSNIELSISLSSVSTVIVRMRLKIGDTYLKRIILVSTDASSGTSSSSVTATILAES